MAQDDVVLVGSKGVARYVMACLYKLFVEGRRSVRLAALGKNIYRAVHAATGVQHLLKEVYTSSIRLSTVQFYSEGRTRRVSRIEIELRLRDLVP